MVVISMGTTHPIQSQTEVVWVVWARFEQVRVGFGLEKYQS